MKMFKLKILSCILMIMLIFSVTVSASINPIIDNADILSSDDEKELRDTIENLRLTYNMDFVIVTSRNLEGKSPQEYADDYYDENEYGLGEDASGILLLIDMDGRNIYISTSGNSINYLTDERIDSIISDIGKYLSNEQYYEGCNIFLTDSKYYLDAGIPENQYSYNESAKVGKVALIALVISIVSAVAGCLLVVYNYKGSKTISSKNYIDRESISFIGKKDTFVSTFTTKTKIEQNNNSGSSGRSTTHTSSSGRSHGGGGGKF